MLTPHISPPSSFPRSLLPHPCAHRQAEAAAALGTPEFAEVLFDSTCCVEALSQ